ncbi:MAG: hypothetical protein ACJ8CB_03295 [Ktedonobacteraceae bacterium]
MPETTKALPRVEPLKRVIPLAVSDRPSSVCGTAHRVGYTSVADGKQPLYRLKLCKVGRKGALLPGFFLLVNGIFVQYEPANTVIPQQEV